MIDKNKIVLLFFVFMLIAGCESDDKSINSDINNAPVISEEHLPIAVVGERFYFQLEASDVENTALNYTVDNAPSWLKINNDTGLIVGDVTQEFVGTRLIRFKVTDGKDYSELGLDLTVVTKEIEQNYLGSTMHEFSTQMILPSIESRYVTVLEQEEVTKKNVNRFDDITFLKQNGSWVIFNNTMFPLDTLVVKSSNYESPMLFNFDDNINPYSRAVIDVNENDFGELVYHNGSKMYLPNMKFTGDNSCDSVELDQTCYDSPKTNSEIETNERTVAYLYLSYNRHSYLESLEKYFEANCGFFGGCRNYIYNELDNLSYAYRGYLTIGQQGHNYDAKVMRNVYAAEGMGGGIPSSLSSLTNSLAFGWASVWAEYLDSHSPQYNALPMWILSHEIGHANGYNHDSGWTYGFPEEYSNNYFRNLLAEKGWDPHTIPNLEMSGIVSKTLFSPHKIKLELMSTTSNHVKSNIKFRLGSEKELKFKTLMENVDDKSSMSIYFNELPESPVFLHVWSDESDIMTTVKFDKIMLSDSLKYTIDTKEFTVLDAELVPDTANGWAIRDICNNGDGSELATKAQYQELYDYLNKNKMLNQLKIKSFLTKDEPVGYLIWNVYFDKDQMNSWYSGMTKPIGEDRSLVCVKSL